MSGAALTPCRLAMSFRRESAAAAVDIDAASASAMAVSRPHERKRIETISFTPSEDLVQQPHEEPGLKAVLDQSLAQRLDPQLADRRREDDVARLDIDRPDDAR